MAAMAEGYGGSWFRTFLTRILDAQVLLLRVSFALHRLRARRRPSGYVVGMEEVAGLLTAVADALDDAVTVNLLSNPLYDRRYDIEFNLNGPRSLANRIRRVVTGPWILGRLAAQRRTFIYLGAQGFLLSLADGRDREFAFLREHGRTVVCYFMGSDIRSQFLTNELGARLGREVVTTYEPLVSHGIDAPAAEAHRRDLAAAAERHAHLIFNAPVDQLGYFTGPTEPALYFFPDERVARRPEKWRDLSRLVVVHAPTSPVIKGTPVVRAAVRGLKEQGYDFEYVELTGRPNGEVLAELERAHIVLGHCYQFIPGIVGLEAMASNAVLVTSADGTIETSLPPGGNDAWVVTPAWLVREHLQALLDHPEGLQAQADAGTAWVGAHCTASVDRARLLARLADVEAGAVPDFGAMRRRQDAHQ